MSTSLLREDRVLSLVTWASREVTAEQTLVFS